MDNKYEVWLSVYRPVLIQCFELIKQRFKDIDPNKKRWNTSHYFDTFCKLAYFTSSKYISPYV